MVALCILKQVCSSLWLFLVSANRFIPPRIERMFSRFFQPKFGTPSLFGLAFLVALGAGLWIDSQAVLQMVGRLLQFGIVAAMLFELSRSQQIRGLLLKVLGYLRKIPLRRFGLGSLFGLTFVIALGAAFWSDPQELVSEILHLLLGGVTASALFDLRHYERVQAVHDPAGFRWFYRLSRFMPLIVWILHSTGPDLPMIAVETEILLGVLAGTLPLAPRYQVRRDWFRTAMQGLGWVATGVSVGALILVPGTFFSSLVIAVLNQRVSWLGPATVPIDQLGVVSGMEKLLAVDRSVEGSHELIAWLVAAGSFLTYRSLPNDRHRCCQVSLLLLAVGLSGVAWGLVRVCSQLLAFRGDWPERLHGQLVFTGTWYLLFCGVAAGYAAYRRDPLDEPIMQGVERELLPDSLLVRSIVFLMAGISLLDLLTGVWNSRPDRDLIGSLQFLASALVVPVAWWGRFRIGHLLRRLGSFSGWPWIVAGLALCALSATLRDRYWWLNLCPPATILISKLPLSLINYPEAGCLLVMAVRIARQATSQMAFALPAHSNRPAGYRFSWLAFVVNLSSIALLLPAAIWLVWRYQFHALFPSSPYEIPWRP